MRMSLGPDLAIDIALSCRLVCGENHLHDEVSFYAKLCVIAR
jgi:hypothetical protein